MSDVMADWERALLDAYKPSRWRLKWRGCTNCGRLFHSPLLWLARRRCSHLGHIRRMYEETAYERGWRDACDDFLEQAHNPSHPIGTRKGWPKR